MLVVEIDRVDLALQGLFEDLSDVLRVAVHAAPARFSFQSHESEWAAIVSVAEKILRREESEWRAATVVARCTVVRFN